MTCHRCKENMKHVGENWENSPCSKCTLDEDSYGTLPYWEDCTLNSMHDESPDDEVWAKERADEQCPQPYANIDEDIGDPSLPLSALVSAMSLWINLSLPARKSIQLRMNNLPYSEIGKRLGVSRQAVEKALGKALAREPLLQHLLPGKEPRDSCPLSGTHKAAVADINRRSGCRKKKSKK